MPTPSESAPETPPSAAASGPLAHGGSARAFWFHAGFLIVALGLSACGRERPRPFGPPSQPPPVRDIDAASRLRIAEAAENSGNWDVAASLYAAAAAAEPNRTDVQARFASALARGGDVPRAEEVLTRALERNPNDVGLQMQLGRLRLRTGAAEQALTIFDRILARQPNNADALDGRGVALDLLDRPNEAQQAYLAARAVAPNDLRIASNLAFSFLLEGRAREARDILEPFASRADMPPRMRTSLAISRAMTGDRDGALGLLGPDVTQQDLDQLVAGLPGTRPSVALRAQQAPADTLREPRRGASAPGGADAAPVWRTYDPADAPPPRPARGRASRSDATQ